MTAHFHPDGTAQLGFCTRCEDSLLEKLLQFKCIQQSGIMIVPRLHPECKTATKRECLDKIDRVMRAMKEQNPLAAVVKETTGIDL